MDEGDNSRTHPNRAPSPCRARKDFGMAFAIGAGLNIAFVPPNSKDVGNCSSSVCVNLFGVQLLGG